MSAGSPQIDLRKNSRKSIPFFKVLMLMMINRFPCVLPFSQMYPLCCIDIRNFLNQFYFFLDDHFQHSDIIDETLRKVLTLFSMYWLSEMSG
jgi:hypothetical protein